MDSSGDCPQDRRRLAFDPMRILRLGSSNDRQDDVPAEFLSFKVVESALAAASSEPVDTVLRGIWPSAELPGLIDGWMERYQPDLVYFRVNPFWYSYESTPLRLRRKLGPVGGAVSRVGLRAGQSPRLARRRLFRIGRDLALRTIGGDAHFTPDQVLETAEACVSRILRHEGVGLVVVGMLGRRLVINDSETGERRRQARRLDVHQRLQELCAARHVRYLGWVEAEAPDTAGPDFAADRLHRNTQGQQAIGAIEAEAMLAAWRESAGVPSTAEKAA